MSKNSGPFQISYGLPILGPNKAHETSQIDMKFRSFLVGHNQGISIIGIISTSIKNYTLYDILP